MSPPTHLLKTVAESWGAPGGEINYAIVEEEVVKPGVVRAAKVGAKFAAVHLDVEPPWTGFYVEAERQPHSSKVRWTFKAPDRAGHADRRLRTIAVKADIRPALAAEVGAHEVFHLSQPEPESDVEKDAQEREATKYGRWARRVLVSSDGVAGRVLKFDGFPYHYITFQGSDRNDVLIAFDNGSRDVYWNGGSKGMPWWARHSVPCPVSVAS